jgi:hypothetical protein
MIAMVWRYSSMKPGPSCNLGLKRAHKNPFHFNDPITADKKIQLSVHKFNKKKGPSFQVLKET